MLKFTKYPTTMKIFAIPMRWGFGDNYCYVLMDGLSKEASIIDPAYPKDVLPMLKQLETTENMHLTSITNTHHHYDHSDGNPLFHELYPSIPIYAGKDSPLVSETPADGSTHKIGKNIEVTAVHTPCHTQDSICWFARDLVSGESAVFTGDTLFNCGCGRFFEGDANQMQAAFAKLAKLPADTKVYPGHEYTKSNVKFAITVDPYNESLKNLGQYCEANEKTTGIFTLKDELSYNPFMRTDDKELQKRLGTLSAVSTMAKLRQLKDKF
ncbi:hydroxyacylglutathione hydrolase [Starmerella bacillaris]|uniref:hydroxyacylglutathione hydrolase n=1 Tax=Starmerella bacillaris TaxID=1247836 RepID=A0AAV5RIQ9_STABA|nr:hydroxyacylglutathione hydrolase [Starmerella bacillaris]